MKSLKNVSTLPTVLYEEASSRLATPKITAAAGELSEAANLIATRTKSFGAAVDKLARTYGKDVVEQQLHLQRVANSAIDLYAMTASVSRASRSISRKLPSAEHERRLAHVICKLGTKRIDQNVREINRGKGHSEDKEIGKIADEVFGKKGYIPPHPVAGTQ